MRTGLVLGGGGVTGIAWLAGALQAFEHELGWSARCADIIVGTSAGALVGALLATGTPAEELSGNGSLARALGRVQLTFAGLPRLGPGSWPLVATTARHRHQHPAAVIATGWLPRGVLGTEPIEAIVRARAGERWPVKPELRTVAMDYRTGRRIVLSAGSRPRLPLPRAVAASCAVPGIYRPVSVASRQLVDGGMCSPSNLDVLRNEGLDSIICLNPMSSLELAAARTPFSWLAQRLRKDAGRRLGREANRLRDAGTVVLLLQPGNEDAAVMGSNYLSGRRRTAITRRAVESVSFALRTVDLPAGLATGGPV